MRLLSCIAALGVLVSACGGSSSSAPSANCPFGGALVATGLGIDSSGVPINQSVNATYDCSGNPQGMSWVNVDTAATQSSMVANAGYIANADDGQLTLLLPPSASLQPGDIVGIQGAGRGGWRIAQNDGQSIDIQGLNAYVSLPGASWTQTTLPTLDGFNAYWQALAISADGSHLVAVAWGDGVYTSSNGGLTWVRRDATHGLPAAATWNSVLISADGSRLVAAVWGGGVYTSTDAGNAWQLANDGVIPTTSSWNSLASSSDGTTLAAASLEDGSVYMSADGGAHWMRRSVGSAGPVAQASVSSSSDGLHLAAFTSPPNTLYTSIDGGATWTPGGSLPIGSTGIYSSSNGMRLALVARGDSIYVSNDGGVSWLRTNSPVVTYPTLASSSDGTRLAVADWNGGWGSDSAGEVYTSADGGVTWMLRTSQLGWIIASSANGTTLLATNPAGTTVSISRSPLNQNPTTTPGTSGGLIGGPADSINLRYIGNGRFTVLSTTGTDFIAY